MSTSSVGEFAVGEENAGIVVLRLMETVDPMAYADADFARDVVPRRRKRAYFSTKRKLRTEEEKVTIRLKKKAEKQLLDVNIQIDMIKGCPCTQQCCQNWRLEEVKELRREIYGVKFDRKLDLIYQKINASQESQDGMVLCYNGRFVCPKAFWQFHGISKSSYYKYKEESSKGAKQGYHGNTGTFKPRESTIQAEAILKKILLEMSEPMPHLNFDNSNGQGTDSFYHRLPSCYDKQDIYIEHCIRMENVGAKKLSRGKYYDLWTKKFANFDFHKKSAFARCTLYEKFKVWLTRERNEEMRKVYQKEREEHLQLQMSGRSCYYSHNQLACDEPSLYKSSIHDGMDSSKTAVPRLDNYVKALSRVGMPVPVKIAGILNRGHGPPALAHVTIGGLWSSDPNFTVSSIAKYLRDCEDFDGDMRGDLVFEKELHHPLLKAFMNKDIFTKTVAAATTLLPQQASTSTNSSPADKPFNKLPPTFYMQLDTSGRDNKNWLLMVFFSKLVARGVFKTVFMYFLIVGHTHEDVDVFFSKVNRALSFQHISNIPQLMAAVMEAEEKKALPRFITEVADYKAHALPYRKPIKGVSQPVAFKFYMQDNRPMYQYQKTYGGPWAPTCGDSLWKRTDPKSKTDFTVIPPPDREPVCSGMAKTHAAAEDIISYLNAYLKHMKAIQEKTNPSNKCYETDQAIIDYWENIKSLFAVEEGWATNSGLPLQDGFWPRTNHGTGYKRPHDGVQDSAQVDEDLLAREAEEELVERNEIFVGNPSEMERERFIPLVDIEPGVMLLIRPCDGFVVKDCFWMAKAVFGVIRQRRPLDPPNTYEVKVEWYRPKHRLSNATDAQRYSHCLRNT
ncbi:hypothetical protein R1sor_025235 [Riccia sorocarpa]|uniref:DUF7869 domain-containing protein n=1 Tax=Riccia sorocarpa TaxID=122646 RepID=A0ABD3G808_9MARC